MLPQMIQNERQELLAIEFKFSLANAGNVPHLLNGSRKGLGHFPQRAVVKAKKGGSTLVPRNLETK